MSPVAHKIVKAVHHDHYRLHETLKVPLCDGLYISLGLDLRNFHLNKRRVTDISIVMRNMQTPGSNVYL